MKYSVLLYNLRSVYNVGSIFRTADGAGFDHVYLAGTTPTPIDRFGRKRSDIHKVALGAEETLSWSYHQDADLLIKEAKTQGAFMCALEQASDSVPYTDIDDRLHTGIQKNTDECILILGEETQGIPQPILNLCDAIIEIPMRGIKESLNVSVAFGVAAYALTTDLRINKK